MLDIIVAMSRLSPLVAGVFTMLMGLFVLIKDVRQFRNRVFFAFCCLLFFWALQANP